MKKNIFLFFMLLATGFSFGQKPAGKTNNAAVPPAIVKLANANDSLQYVLGSYVAQWLNGTGFTINNASLFLRGMNDVFQDAPRAVPDSVAKTALVDYQKNMQKDVASRLEQQLFAQLKDKPGVGMLPSGVRYVVLNAGKGARPLDTDSLLLNLSARLLDGTIIEDTYKTGKPFAATVNSFFSGLNETLSMMPLHAKWQLFIPAAQAYGDKGTATIPPNSALVLEVELLEIKPTKK